MWGASFDDEQVKSAKLPDQFLGPDSRTSCPVLKIHPVGLNVSKGLLMPDQRQSSRKYLETLPIHRPLPDHPRTIHLTTTSIRTLRVRSTGVLQRPLRHQSMCSQADVRALRLHPMDHFPQILLEPFLPILGRTAGPAHSSATSLTPALSLLQMTGMQRLGKPSFSQHLQAGKAIVKARNSICQITSSIHRLNHSKLEIRPRHHCSL